MSYTTGEILPITIQIKLIEEKEFAISVLDLKPKAFVIHVAAFSVNSSNKMHLLRRAWIAQLKVDETFTKVPTKYANFVDVFLAKLATKLSKHMGINHHTIELVDDQQPPYCLIYNLGVVELEILNIYIENNLISGFIKPSKFPSRAFIFFDKKSNRSL